VLKTESNLSETTERAAALLQELRLRLNAETPHQETPPPDVPVQADAPVRESPEELDRELQAYFSNPPAEGRSVLNEIRDRVVEGVVDRIIRAWEEPQGLASGVIEQAVVERLIERVIEGLGKDARSGRDSIGSRQSERARLPRSAAPR
jgi:hypothetical protein